MLRGSLDGSSVWGRRNTRLLWLGSFAVYLKLSQCHLLIVSTSVQNKERFKDYIINISALFQPMGALYS